MKVDGIANLRGEIIIALWETRSWNQVIVRTGAGQKLIDLARDKGVLEFREVPTGSLEKLKKASAGKKGVSQR